MTKEASGYACTVEPAKGGTREVAQIIARTQSRFHVPLVKTGSSGDLRKNKIKGRREAGRVSFEVLKGPHGLWTVVRWQQSSSSRRVSVATVSCPCNEMPIGSPTLRAFCRCNIPSLGRRPADRSGHGPCKLFAAIQAQTSLHCNLAGRLQPSELANSARTASRDCPDPLVGSKEAAPRSV